MNGSNLYGYADGYHGPKLGGGNSREAQNKEQDNDESNQSEEHNPLQVGFWMEGDSLAPPCGSSISTIHALLQFANVTNDDVVYDLGCGDARVCLEAFALYRCQSVGIEIEQDLVDRANILVENLADQVHEEKLRQRLPLVLQQDLRQVLDALVLKATYAYSSPSSAGSSISDAGERQPLSESLASLPLPTLIVMYLLPEAIETIRDGLIQLLCILPSNFRIVCNTWGITSLRKTRAIEVQEDSLALTPLILYDKNSLERNTKEK
jgi:hypothetical protein